MRPVKVSTISQDYRDAGALNSLIQVCAFLNEHTFLTKSGDLGVVFRVRGIDYEGCEKAELDAYGRRFERTLRGLSEDFRLYQYMLKRTHPDIPVQRYRDDPVVDRAVQGRFGFLQARAESLYSLQLYFVLLHQAVPFERRESWKKFLAEPGRTLIAWMSGRQQLTVLASELAERERTLFARAESFRVQLQDFLDAELLDKRSAFCFLSRLLNYAPFRSDTMQLRSDLDVDQQLATSSLECYRDRLQLNAHHVKVLSVTEPPANTFAHMSRSLLELRSNVVAVSEWRRVSNVDMRKAIRTKRRHFHNSKTSLANYLSDAPTSDRHLLVDDADEALVRELGGALEEMEMNGGSFGEWSMTVVLYDLDRAKLDGAVAECVKRFNTQDATVIDERYNLLNAWLAVLPGNHRYNLRKLYLLDSNCADLSFLFTLHLGELRNPHLNQEYLAVLETDQGTPYFLNLHYQDNAHTVILGATGAGKSFLLSFLLTNLQKYHPFSVIFDLGGGYEALTRLFSGRYVRVGVNTPSVTINPFCLAPTRENLQFLYRFVSVLIESSHHELSGADERDLYEQIENLYEVEPGLRRLGTLSNIVNRRIADPLRKWVGEGQFGRLFDNGDDNLSLASFQCFDFEGMDRYPELLEPLLFYILHRANTTILASDQATAFKVVVMDEAWRFFRNRTIQTYIVEALKTWRKKNAALIVATQSGDDLYRSDLLPVIVESCATQMFLANPGMDRDAYRERFHLNHTEAELIAGLIPKQQFLLKRPHLAKVVNLYVDPTEYWLYTNSPYDNARRQEAFEKHGFERGLELLAQESAS